MIPVTIDIIVPARNEAENIPALLAAIPAQTARHVVVADNGSTDQTAQLAREHGAKVVHESKPGYGGACLAGLRWLGELDTPPDIVVFIDADLADDPSLIASLCAPIARGEVDFVIASRRRLAQPGSLTALQHVGNFVACIMIKFFTGVAYRDLGPMRAIRWITLGQLEMRDRTWGWTVEMQYKAAALGVRTLEVDVPYRTRRAGRSKISGTILGSVQAGTKIIMTIFALWRRMRPRRRR